MPAIQAKRIREQQRKTLKECADVIGVSVAQVSRFENGTRELKGRQLILLADFLRAKPTELLERETAVA